MTSETRSKLPCLLFGLLCNIPFLFPLHQAALPSFYQEWLAIFLGLAAALALAWRTQVWHIPRIALAPPALAMLVAVQAGSGMFAYGSNALLMCACLLWAALLMCAVSTLRNQIGSEKLATNLAWAWLAGGLLNAGAGLLQYAGISDWFGMLITPPMDVRSAGIYGNLAQQNHFATHLALAIAAGIHLHFKGHLRRSAVLACSLVLSIALILSASRSSLLYLLCLVGFAFFLQRRANGGSGWRIPWKAVLIGVVLLCAGSWLLITQTSLPQLERLRNPGAALGPRAFLWQQAWQMFLNHPWLGVGMEGFAWQMSAQIAAGGLPNPYGIDQFAHNLFLQLLACTGLPGLLLVLLPLAAWLRRQSGTTRSASDYWSLASLGILFIHSMLEQPLYYVYFLAAAAIWLALADREKYVCTLRASGHSLLLSGLVLALFAGLKSAYDFDQLDTYLYSEPAPVSSPAQAAEAAQARIDAAHRLRRFSLWGAYAELALPEAFVAADAPVAQRLAFNQHLARFAPVAEIEYRQAALLAEAGQIDAAQMQFTRALLAYPEQGQEYVQRLSQLAERDTSRVEGQHYASLSRFAQNRWRQMQIDYEKRKAR